MNRNQRILVPVKFVSWVSVSLVDLTVASLVPRIPCAFKRAQTCVIYRGNHWLKK
jgi:hypothetical protein